VVRIQMAKLERFAPPQILAPYKPHPHQVAFHQDLHKYRALVTGVGAGKTRMGAEEVVKWTQVYPGSVGVIGRLESTSLKKTTQRRFFEVLNPDLIAHFDRKEQILWVKTPAVWPDGPMKGQPVYSEIYFIHLDEPGPLGSLDISWFWIDEAHEPDGQEVPEEVFDQLCARVGRHPIGPWRGFVTSNSGGQDWIYQKFFNPAKMDSKLYIGWTASTDANSKFLPPGYVEELRSTKPKSWVDRFLDASFDAFEGQIFLDFDEDKHTFDPRTFIVDPSWIEKEGGVGFDFGVRAPTCAEYGCLDGKGRVIIYDEDYQAEADIDKFAELILSKGFDTVFADPSVVNRGPTKKSPKELYQDAGVTLLTAANDIDYFVTLFTKLLRADMILISRKCKHLIKQIKIAAWNPNVIAGTSLKETMKVFENHALDAFKYLLNTIGMNPELLSAVGKVRYDGAVTINGEPVHESFLEDKDLLKSDYPFPEIARAVTRS
jgi:phage terminase large subunit